jgi:hypothetical protein
MNASEDGLSRCFDLVSDYFAAVQSVFEDDWVGHNPRTSRLVHGSGIIAMGFLMEDIALSESELSVAHIEDQLRTIKSDCNWTSGNWNFGPGEMRKWNDLQVLPKDFLQLSNFLIRKLRSRRPLDQVLPAFSAAS